MFSKRENTYIKIRPIGSGSYGQVYLVETNEGNKYAMKSVDSFHLRKPDDLRRHIHEINILSFNNSQYLLKLKDIYYSNDNLNLITPHYSGGNLDNYIFKYKTLNRKIPHNIIWSIFIQICMGLKQLHFNGIIHRDIKPANILLDNREYPKNAVICDFGASIILDKATELCKTCIGTPYFMSPEAGDHVVYTKKTDVWSLGCLLYELIMLEKPFVAPNIYLLNMKIRRGIYKELPKYEGNDYDIWNELIKKMLITKESNRISVRSILDNEHVKNKIKLLGLTYEKSGFFEIPFEFQNKLLADYTKLDIYSNAISAYLKKNEDKSLEIIKKEIDNKTEISKKEQEKFLHLQKKEELNNIQFPKIEEEKLAHIHKKQELNNIQFPKKELVNDIEVITPNDKPSRYVSRIKSIMNINVQVEYN